MRVPQVQIFGVGGGGQKRINDLKTRKCTVTILVKW